VQAAEQCDASRRGCTTRHGQLACYPPAFCLHQLTPQVARASTRLPYSYRAVFFKNWAAGKPPAACADDDGHNVASMGGFVLLPPVALFTAVQALRKHMSASAGTSVEVGAAAPVAASGGGSGAAGVATAGASNSISAPCIAASEAPGAVALAATVASPLDSVPLPLDPAPSGVTAAAVDATVAQMYCTHNSKQLEGHARVYAELLVRVLLGADLRTAVADAGAAIGIDVPALHRAHGKGPLTRVVGRMFSPACYIDGSFPSLLYMAYAFADDPEAALIGNTNAGGENCHRCVNAVLRQAAERCGAASERSGTGIAPGRTAAAWFLPPLPQSLLRVNEKGIL